MRGKIARELTALADGTLPAARRKELLRRVSASPALQRALRRQLFAVNAVRRLDTAAPTGLRDRIERLIAASRR